MRRYLLPAFVLCLLAGCGGEPEAGDTRAREIDGLRDFSRQSPCTRARRRRPESTRLLTHAAA